MISLDAKIKSSSAIESIIARPDKNTRFEQKETLSFAELLRGVSVKKDGKELVQNGLLVLSLADTSKESTKIESQKITTSSLNIDTLLDEIEKSQEKITPLELNPKITKNLTIDELKSLIKDAKEYLKNKIIQSGDFKKSEIAALPKTIKGLMQVAKKFDIDISKITIEELRVTKDEEALPQKKLLNVNIKEINQKTTPLESNNKEVPIQIKKSVVSNKGNEEKFVKTKQADIINTKEVPIQIKKSVVLNEGNEEKPVTIKNENIVNVKKEEPVSSELRIQSKDVKKIFAEEGNKKETKEIVREVEKKVDKVVTTKTNFQNIQDTQRVENSNRGDSLAVEQSRVHSSKEISKMPLFKVQAKEITTQELVTTKLNTTHSSAQKHKTEDTLKLLLRGTNLAKKETNLTADFSVATARVLVSSAIKESVKGLESLLRGDSKDEKNSVVGKTDTLVATEALVVNKADSFEVKLNEAKQMIKYISQDVKTAIENYKAPFTRVKLQLNPQRLGEVDLIIVQRGKNLHINLSSNNVAINTLAMNANDLKVQLSNSGINNASLNFSNNSQSSDSNAQQQQNNQQQQREAKEEYKYFENQERNEEIINSLEIVVPNYA